MTEVMVFSGNRRSISRSYGPPNEKARIPNWTTSPSRRRNPGYLRMCPRLSYLLLSLDPRASTKNPIFLIHDFPYDELLSISFTFDSTRLYSVSRILLAICCFMYDSCYAIFTHAMNGRLPTQKINRRSDMTQENGGIRQELCHVMWANRKLLRRISPNKTHSGKFK